MADILIKNIGNLSKECNECLRTYIAMNDGDKNLIGSLSVDCKTGFADCPLVALPEPHGRLGDLDALQKQIEDDIETVAKEKGKVGLRELWQILNKNIENAPVIVEATE